MESRYIGGGSGANSAAPPLGWGSSGVAGRAKVTINPPANLLLPPSHFTTTTASHAIQHEETRGDRGQVDAVELQAEDQVQLMAMYHKLQDWQAEQQELLMRQQREQLDKLEGEQERVHKFLARQRAWGGGGTTGGGGQQPQGLPPSGNAASPAQHSQLQNNITPPKQKTPASGRPVPNIPSVASTPTEYREYGNPNLDSDTASVASTCLSMDFQPLPADTASEVSHVVHKPPAAPSHVHPAAPAAPAAAAAAHKHVAHRLSNPLSKYQGESDNEAGSEVGDKSPRKTLDFNNFSLMSERSDSGQVAPVAGDGGAQGQRQQVQGGVGAGSIQGSRHGQGGGGAGSIQGSRHGQGGGGHYPGQDSGRGELGVGRAELLKLIHESGITDEATIVALLQDQLCNLKGYSENTATGNNEMNSRQLQGYYDSLNGVSDPDVQHFTRTNYNVVGGEQLQRHTAVDRNGAFRQDFEQPQRNTTGISHGASNNRPDNNAPAPATSGKVQSSGTVVNSSSAAMKHFTGGVVRTGGYRGYIEEDEVMVEEEETDGSKGAPLFKGYREDEGRYLTEGYPMTVKSALQQMKNVDYQRREEKEDEDEDEDEDEEEEEESYVTEEGEEEEEDITYEPEVPKNYDDQPVGGLGAKKTFEQLLEEELRKEQSSGIAGSAMPTLPISGKSGGVFLRKGEGIARFGMAGRKKAQPNKPVQHKKPATTQPTKAPVTLQKNIVKGKPPTRPAPSKKDTKKVASLKLVKPERKLMGKVAKVGDDTNNNHQPKRKLVQNKTETVIKADAGGTEAQSTENAVLSSGESAKSDSGANVRNDSVGDASFQKVMKKKKVEEKIEKAQLDEFEILEQYADDNASFLSNVSAVNRVLNQRKQRFPPTSEHPTQNNGSQRPVHPAYRDSSDSDSDSDDSTSADSDSEMDQTLEYSSPHQKPLVEMLQKLNNGAPDTTTTTTSATAASDTNLRTLQRKVVSMENRTPNKDDDDDDWEEKNTTVNNNNNTAAAASPTSKICNTHSVLPGEEAGNTSANNAHSGHPLRPRPHSSSEEDEDEDDDDDMLRIAMTEHRENGADVDFCDAAAWDDSQAGVYQYHQLNSHIPHSRGSSRVSSRGVGSSGGLSVITKEIVTDYGGGGAISAVSSGSSIDTGANIPLAGQPPTSHLVTKLFPSLRPPAPVQPTVQPGFLDASRQPAVDGASAKAIRDKLAELENEIQKFRADNASLDRLRREKEQGLEHLKKEMAEFEKQKNEELQRIKDFKEEETRKLKKERRVFEQYQKSSRPDKKEREEVDALKLHVEELQEEMRRKESRWNAATARLRDRMELVDTENTELKQEIAFLEKRRLEAWQSKDVAAGGSAKTQKALAATIPAPAKQSNSHAGPSMLQMEPLLRKKDIAARRKDAASTRSKDSAKARSHIAESDVTIGPEDSASNIMSTSAEGGVPQPMHARPAAPTPQPERVEGMPAPEGLPRKLAQGGSGGGKSRSTIMSVDKGDGQYEERQHDDGKVERIYSNNAREILFGNGTRKQVTPDGLSIIVSFFNGDMKQVLPDERVVYYFANTQTTHTSYPDALEVILFPNGQEEKHYPDGTKEITFADQTTKYMFPSGEEETLYQDGTIIRINANGIKTMEFANGQREVHTETYKTREYPDGTVKTVFPNGRAETRYSTGRLRIKDQHGNIIVDKQM